MDAILEAKRIYFAGFGSSSWPGGLLRRCLDRYCKNVQLLTSMEGSSYGARIHLASQTTDLLIAIAYPRYSNDTVLLARRAKGSLKAAAPVPCKRPSSKSSKIGH